MRFYKFQKNQAVFTFQFLFCGLEKVNYRIELDGIQPFLFIAQFSPPFNQAAPGESAETPGKYCQQKGGMVENQKKVGTLFFLPP